MWRGGRRQHGSSFERRGRYCSSKVCRMKRIIVNALSLRPGGGLQVVGGLLAGFSATNTYVVFYSDPASLNLLRQMLGERSNITYVNPVGSTQNMLLFAWQMLFLRGALKRHAADVVLNINHHFPSGGVRQVVYHLNVLRFQLEKRFALSVSEIADQLRDWRAATALKHADANVFESRYLCDIAHTTRGPAKNSSVVYIGLKPGASVDLTPAGGPQTSTLLAMTSPQPHKDNHVLLETLARLRMDCTSVDWRLKIAGGRTPDAFANLKCYAEKLGVGANVEWLGFMSHDKLQHQAVSCLCLISPSRVESFCMVALEAMRWGLPTVVANATSMPESVGDAGLLAEPGNALSFANAILSLRDNIDLWRDMRMKGLSRAATQSWTTAASQIEAVLIR
jgi:glycosyltransferase involved in cell wall biosynthesis